jgi:uncharacterized RmlC-like cupin family protein
MTSKADWIGHDVTVVRPAGKERIKQDIFGVLGVNEVSTGSRALSMLVTMFGPGEFSNAHYHLEHESALYGVSGDIQMFYGDELEHEILVGAGDFIYIPPFLPHKSFNRSRTKDAVFVTARSDPMEQERVVVTPDVDDGRCDARVRYID